MISCDLYWQNLCLWSRLWQFWRYVLVNMYVVSKTFGEWYQKTNKTEDKNKLNLLAFKIIAILHNTLLATFIKLLKTVSKSLFRNRSQNRCHTCSWIAATSAKLRLSGGETERSPQSPDRGLRWMIENRYAALSQELVDTDRTVCRRVIVQQLPLSSPVHLWPNTVDTNVATVGRMLLAVRRISIRLV
jgi:hypothetical protein